MQAIVSRFGVLHGVDAGIYVGISVVFDCSRKEVVRQIARSGVRCLFEYSSQRITRQGDIRRGRIKPCRCALRYSFSGKRFDWGFVVFGNIQLDV